MITIVSIKKTCDACPSQWEGTLDDGRMFYIRYRHGHGSIRVSAEITDDVGDAVRGEEIASWEGAEDGFCSLSDIVEQYPSIKFLCKI